MAASLSHPKCVKLNLLPEGECWHVKSMTICNQVVYLHILIDPLWPTNATWQQLWAEIGSGNVFLPDGTMLYLDQCWLIVNGACCHLAAGYFTEHYNDVIMSTMASPITTLRIVYSIVYLGTDQRKHQSSASIAFVKGIHPWPVNSPAQRAINAENVSIWWRHHGLL